MKIFLLTIFCLINLSAYSQVSLPYKDGKVVYEKIDSIDNATKAKIFSAAKKWLADNFKNPKQVIQSEDEATGQIIGKGQILIKEISSVPRVFNVSIQIDCRDNKFRVRIYDIEVQIDLFGSYDIVTAPIEIYDSGQRTRQNRLQKWEVSIVQINKYIDNLTSAFSKSIISSTNDGF